ncbi:hypothetical protein C8R48DRAFT_351010 [Suillus tomentosus]|nr:hypothetical protein C8R48DRAFT_351010 [Suillus tomentosus]
MTNVFLCMCYIVFGLVDGILDFYSPSLMTMVLMLIASSIGARWAPQSRGAHTCAQYVVEI